MSDKLDHLRAELLVAEAKVEAYIGESHKLVREACVCVSSAFGSAFEMQEIADKHRATGNEGLAKCCESLANAMQREAQRMAREIEHFPVIS